MNRIAAGIFIVSILLVSGIIYAFTPQYIHAPAVILANNTGTLTLIKLNVTPGTGNVIISGVPGVGNSTIQSAYTAAKYAAHYTNLNFSKYNFTYTIENVDTNVSGPSAGAAMTILAISVLSNKTLRTDFTMTGTIFSNGNIGLIGGVYDKAAAARLNKLDFVLVPKTQNGSAEDELYYLVQTAFNIPLIQVSNISDAVKFALSNKSIIDNQTKYNFYTNYSVNKLNASNEICVNYCNESIFSQFVNFTFNMTHNQISNLSKLSNFSNVTVQLNNVLNQSILISKKNYLYTGADFAFIDYLNAYFFSHAYYTRQQGLNTLNGIETNCNDLVPPKLSFNNFDMVLNAELRQAWAEFTINQTIANYNLSAEDSDQVLMNLYSGAEANAWCKAAGFIYSKDNSSKNSTDITLSNLSDIANSTIKNASAYPGMYLSVAQQAYKNRNYPIAILSADYAYSQGSSQALYNLNNSQLNNMSQSMLSNQFYGSFAVNFANQARFYMQEEHLTNNSTLMHNYAYQAYFSSLLAQKISNSIQTIRNHMYVNETAVLNANINNLNIKVDNISVILNNIEYILYLIVAIAAIIAILLFAIILVLIRKLHYGQANYKKIEKKRK